MQSWDMDGDDDYLTEEESEHPQVRPPLEGDYTEDEVFAHIDRNMDGLIDVAEMRQFLFELDLYPHDQLTLRARAAIRRKDKDGDGRLTLDEFVSRKSRESWTPRRGRPSQHPAGTIGRRRFGGPSSGSMRKRPIKFSAPVLPSFQGNSTEEKAFADIDTNNDGLLDVAEIKRFFVVQGSYPGQEGAMARDSIEAYDKDGDGKLNFEEFKSAK